MEATKNSTSSLKTNIYSIVPQLFYDVIARIIPGSFIVFLSLLLYWGPETTHSKIKFLLTTDISFSKFLILTFFWSIISYVISILLWCQFVFPVYLVNYIKKNEKTKCSDSVYDTMIRCKSFKYDYIKLKDTASGNRITKLSAEIHMTEVLAIGFVYLLFSGIILNLEIVSDLLVISFYGLRYIISAFSFVGFIGAFFCRKYFKERASIAIKNCYEILNAYQR